MDIQNRKSDDKGMVRNVMSVTIWLVVSKCLDLVAVSETMDKRPNPLLVKSLEVLLR